MSEPVVFVGEKFGSPFSNAALLSYEVRFFQALSDFQRFSETLKAISVVIADLDHLLEEEPDFRQIVRSLRQLAPESRLICLSSKAATQQVVEAIQLGAHNFLTKPISHNDLTAALNSALPPKSRISQPTCTAVEDGYGLQPDVASVQSLAETSMPVLIAGEAATGKSTLAKLIHQRSKRSELPFVEFACGKSSAAVSTQNLIGYVRGSFVGAISNHRGCMEVAGRGTLLLESIDQMDLKTQQDLYSVLKSGKLAPLGGQQKPFDARVIATSTRSVDELLQEGKMLPELGLLFTPQSVNLLPLRSRRRELPKIAEQVVAKVIGPKHLDLLTPELLMAIRDYQWPGNFSEMLSIIQRLSETRNSRHVAELLRRKTVTRQWPNIAANKGPQLAGPATNGIIR